jgi:tRNA-(ms[2]io[6]A)-hydroxylase
MNRFCNGSSPSTRLTDFKARASCSMRSTPSTMLPEESLLLVPTPAAWVAHACANAATLLIDHANCEKKAASTALALMFAYAEDLYLTDKMSRLAREELRHYEQVAKLIRSLGITPVRLSPGRYAEGLRRAVARSEPQREMDLMICGAVIEARSCERFDALAPAIAGPIGVLFGALHAAVARHNRMYLDLARRVGAREGLDLAARCSVFAAIDAELVCAPDPVFRFHSGVPSANDVNSKPL